MRPQPEHFPEIETDFAVRRNPDNDDHILVTVFVPFYDNERELEFSRFLAEIESESHLETGIHISLMERYVSNLHPAAVEHELQAA